MLKVVLPNKTGCHRPEKGDMFQALRQRSTQIHYNWEGSGHHTTQRMNEGVRALLPIVKLVLFTFFSLTLLQWWQVDRVIRPILLMRKLSVKLLSSLQKGKSGSNPGFLDSQTQTDSRIFLLDSSRTELRAMDRMDRKKQAGLGWISKYIYIYFNDRAV